LRRSLASNLRRSEAHSSWPYPHGSSVCTTPETHTCDEGRSDLRAACTAKSQAEYSDTTRRPKTPLKKGKVVPSMVIALTGTEIITIHLVVQLAIHVTRTLKFFNDRCICREVLSKSCQSWKRLEISGLLHVLNAHACCG
jgi:hypothetical protein